MSDLDDLDDLDNNSNESFENDKKVNPAQQISKGGKISSQVKYEAKPNLKEPLDESYEVDDHPKRGRKGADSQDEEEIRGKDQLNNGKQAPKMLQGEVHSAKRSSSRLSDRGKPAPKGETVIPTTNSIQNSGVENNSNRQALIEKNQKLKSELRMLAGELDNILVKEKQKREQRYAHKEDDDELKDRKQRVAKQMGEINKLKANIVRVKNQLQNVFDNNNVIQKEDELLYLKKQIAEIKMEHDGLQIINEKQQEALNEYKDNGQYSSNSKKLRETLAKTKEDYRKLSESVGEQEKEMRKQHEALLNKEEAIRMLTERINEKKRGGSQAAQAIDEDFSEKDVEELEEKIKEQENKRKQLEKQFQERQKHLEKEKKDLLNEQTKKIAILRSKEKELKLNQIKLKEVEKYIKNLNNKDDLKSVVSENNLDNAKNLPKQLKRPPIFHKKQQQQSKSPMKSQQQQQQVRSEAQEKLRTEIDDIAGEDRGRKKERDDNLLENNQKEQQQHGNDQKSRKKSVVESHAEEEVDLDDAQQYEEEFDEYDSKKGNSEQGKRKKDADQQTYSDRLQSNESSSRPSKNQNEKQFSEQGTSMNKQNNNQGINSIQTNNQEKQVKGDDEREDSQEKEKQEEENVFSKPSFLKKKK